MNAIWRVQKMLIKRRAILVCVQALLLFVPDFAIAQKSPSQYDVEAAYLFRFSKFLRQPPKADPPLTFDICTLGEDPFGQTLQQITANEQAGNLSVHVV